MIPWLDGDTPFPAVSGALEDPNGLLAAGGDLSIPRLLDAYRHGIFPWYSAGQPLLWWSPDPRMVMEPAAFRISRSLRKRLRRADYEVRVDTCFPEVMKACAAPRP
jgi:leucyl/phenylalanyl-tRNA---protein transferase